MRGEATKHCKLPWTAETVGNSPSKLLRLYKHFASIHLCVSLNTLCQKISSWCLEILCSLKCRVRLHAWGLFPVVPPMNGSFKGQKLSPGPPPPPGCETPQEPKALWQSHHGACKPSWLPQHSRKGPASPSALLLLVIFLALVMPWQCISPTSPSSLPAMQHHKCLPPWQSLSVIYRPARLCKEMLLWKHLRLPFVYLITQHTACLSPVHLLIEEKLFLCNVSF